MSDNLSYPNAPYVEINYLARMFGVHLDYVERLIEMGIIRDGGQVAGTYMKVWRREELPGMCRDFLDFRKAELPWLFKS